MELQKQSITDMQRHIDACSSYINALAKGYRSPEKANTLLNAAMNQMEFCCIEMRRLCEQAHPALPTVQLGRANDHHKEIYGEVLFRDNSWMNIRMNALLPHCKTTKGTQYVSNTITRLLNQFMASGGKLPFFENAYVAIVEHAPQNAEGAFDHDNKGFKSVINALKGRLLPKYAGIALAVLYFYGMDVRTVSVSTQNVWREGTEPLFTWSPIQNIKAIFTPHGLMIMIQACFKSTENHQNHPLYRNINK